MCFFCVSKQKSLLLTKYIVIHLSYSAGKKHQDQLFARKDKWDSEVRTGPKRWQEIGEQNSKHIVQVNVKKKKYFYLINQTFYQTHIHTNMKERIICRE